MFIVRGNNVFPPAVEAVLRRFPEVAEFRVTIRKQAAMAEVILEIEPMPEVGETSALVSSVSQAVQEALHFRAEVSAVPVGTLPRFEMKAKRFVRVNVPGA